MFIVTLCGKCLRPTLRHIKKHIFKRKYFNFFKNILDKSDMHFLHVINKQNKGGTLTVLHFLSLINKQKWPIDFDYFRYLITVNSPLVKCSIHNIYGPRCRLPQISYHGQLSTSGMLHPQLPISVDIYGARSHNPGFCRQES